eukprot:2175688-Rhodomonas_salina.1
MQYAPTRLTGTKMQYAPTRLTSSDSNTSPYRPAWYTFLSPYAPTSPYPHRHARTAAGPSSICICYAVSSANVAHIDDEVASVASEDDFLQLPGWDVRN